jgi:hypothetical protein
VQSGAVAGGAGNDIGRPGDAAAVHDSTIDFDPTCPDWRAWFREIGTASTA